MVTSHLLTCFTAESSVAIVTGTSAIVAGTILTRGITWRRRTLLEQNIQQLQALWSSLGFTTYMQCCHNMSQSKDWHIYSMSHWHKSRCWNSSSLHRTHQELGGGEGEGVRTNDMGTRQTWEVWHLIYFVSCDNPLHTVRDCQWLTSFTSLSCKSHTTRAPTLIAAGVVLTGWVTWAQSANIVTPTPYICTTHSIRSEVGVNTSTMYITTQHTHPLTSTHKSQLSSCIQCTDQSRRSSHSHKLHCCSKWCCYHTL